MFLQACRPTSNPSPSGHDAYDASAGVVRMANYRYYCRDGGGRISLADWIDGQWRLSAESCHQPTRPEQQLRNWAGPKDSALAIGFGSTDKASQAILSLAAYPRYVSLFLLNGAKLDDPNKIMEGCGSKARHIKLRPVSLLENPDVIALIDAAFEQAAMPMPGNGTAPLIIKSISEKQRPRRSS